MAFRSATTAFASSISVKLSLPAGAANGDIITLCASGDNSATGFTWPSGFSSGVTFVTASPDGQAFGVTWKIAASEPSSYTITLAAGAGTDMSAIALAHSGRAGVASSSATSLKTTAIASAFGVVTAGVTAAAGDDIIWFAAADTISTSTASWTAPTNYTLQGTVLDKNTAAWSECAVATRDNVSAGATGTSRFTATSKASAGWGSFVLNLPAAAVAGAVGPGNYYSYYQTQILEVV